MPRQAAIRRGVKAATVVRARSVRSLSSTRPGIRTALQGPLAGSFASSGVIQGLNVITGVLLARSLGPTGRGELAAILLWPGLLATVGSLGVGDGIAYHAARQTAPIQTLVGTIAAFWAVQTAAVAAVGAALVPLVLGHYGQRATHLAMLYLLVYTPFYLAIVHVTSLLQGLQRFAAFQTLRLSQIILTTAGFLMFAAFAGLGLREAVVVYIGTSAIVGAAALVLLSRVCTQRPTFDSQLARAIFGFALRSHTGNVSSLLNERLDQLVISVFLAPVQLGLYVVAATLTSLTSLVGQSVAVIALPVVAAEQSGPTRVALARGYIRLTILGSTALTVLMIVLTPTLIAAFFGHAFAPATTVTRVLLVAAVALTTTRLVQSMLKAAGRPLDAGISEFVAVGVTVASLAILLPWLGILGAGIASLLAYSVSAGWTASRAASAFGLSSVRLIAWGPVPTGPEDVAAAEAQSQRAT